MREREDRTDLTNELLQRFNFIKDLSWLLNFVSMTSPTVWRIVMWFCKVFVFKKSNRKQKRAKREIRNEKFKKFIHIKLWC